MCKKRQKIAYKKRILSRIINKTNSRSWVLDGIEIRIAGDSHSDLSASLVAWVDSVELGVLVCVETIVGSPKKRREKIKEKREKRKEGIR